MYGTAETITSYFTVAQLMDASNLISCITSEQFEGIIDYVMQKYFRKDVQVSSYIIYSSKK